MRLEVVGLRPAGVISVMASLFFVLSVWFLCVPSPLMADEMGRNAGLAQVSDTGRGVGPTREIEISTEIGSMRVELYPDKAPGAVAALIELVKSGYYESDTVLESRPDLGFVIAKIGESAQRFDFKDDASDLVSRRGSVAISKSSVADAYLNNIFFGYTHQPELQQHYVIIGQVVDGLELHEQARPAVIYKVNAFSLVE